MFSWRSGVGWHEAVCAAVVDRATGKVGAPFLGGEEGEDGGLFGRVYEGGEDV